MQYIPDTITSAGWIIDFNITDRIHNAKILQEDKSYVIRSKIRCNKIKNKK